MKHVAIVLVAGLATFPGSAQFKLKPSGLTWDPLYVFDRSNSFKLEFFAKKNELMKTTRVRTFFQSSGENFSVRFESDRAGQGMETIIDRKNLVGIQMLGTGGGALPTCTAGRFKYPEPKDLKKLELVPTPETKEILGYPCKKFTYTYKKIFGEVWITEQLSMSNDLGIFRAGKMAALHNTVSVPGFIMAMTTEDAGGGRTLMTTVSLQNTEDYSVDFKQVAMGTAFNTISYYSY